MYIYICVCLAIIQPLLFPDVLGGWNAAISAADAERPATVDGGPLREKYDVGSVPMEGTRHSPGVHPQSSHVPSSLASSPAPGGLSSRMSPSPLGPPPVLLTAEWGCCGACCERPDIRVVEYVCSTFQPPPLPGENVPDLQPWKLGL